MAIDHGFRDAPPLLPVNYQEVVEGVEYVRISDGGGVRCRQLAEHHRTIVELRDIGKMTSLADVLEPHLDSSALAAASSVVKIAMSRRLSSCIGAGR